LTPTLRRRSFTPITRRQISKRALAPDGKLIGIRLAGETQAQSWLKEVMAATKERRSTLDPALIRWAVAPIGKRPGKLPQRSRIVCNCADVSEAQIKADLESGATLAVLQEKRKCGTFCGSCLPELRQMVISDPARQPNCSPEDTIGGGMATSEGRENMNLAAVIREIGRGATGARDMSRGEAQALYAAMLDGQVPDLEQGAIAIALRMKTETVDEMVGFLAAANERLPSPAPAGGRIRPVVIPTYNGARRSANLTPLLALLLQRFGVPVLLHGLSDDYGRVTSEQVLREFGLQPSSSLQQAQL
jgi:bacterioferritin-associated ferredoxin